MKAADEEALFRRLARYKPGMVFPYTVVEELKLIPKAARATLEKWYRKGWFESGVSIETGWLTKEGLAEAERRGYEVCK